MKRRITERVFMLASILKWIVLPIIVGLIVGLFISLFLKLLEWSIVTVGQLPYYFLFLPVAFFLSVVLVDYLAPDAEGHGTEKVIAAIHRTSGRINLLVAPIKLLTTVITIAFGGSVGKEGPCTQIGAGLASTFASVFHFSDAERRKLVICGMSAGFAAVFGTPIAAAIFAVEVLFIGSVVYEVLLPSFVAALISQQVTFALGIPYEAYSLSHVPEFSYMFFIEVILAGLFFGLVASMLIDALEITEKMSKRLKIWKPYKGLIGGTILVGVTLLFSTRYLGLGLETVTVALQGEVGRWYDFIAKIITTSITLAFGGSGGILTPIFFIGATAGNLFAQIMHLDIAVFSALGLIGLLAGATNAPISATILAVELFGPAIAPYAAFVSVVSFLMTGHASVYPSQVLAMKKSPSVDVDLGKEIEESSTRFKPTNRSLVKIIGKMLGQNWYK